MKRANSRVAAAVVAVTMAPARARILIPMVAGPGQEPEELLSLSQKKVLVTEEVMEQLVKTVTVKTLTQQAMIANHRRRRRVLAKDESAEGTWCHRPTCGGHFA